jgi:membrane protein implicated in regulation of membrane protease activity
VEWIGWLIAAAALIILELFTGTFVLLMLGVGALAASFTALAAPEQLWLQVLVFGVVSALALWVVRPWINKRIERGRSDLGLAKIEGADVVVVERIDRDHGMVKIEGELWRARPYDADKIYEPGERVRVVKVDGATALVWRD